MLSDAELDRYARQIILPQFGGAGQAKLKAAHVALIGAGGIGCPAITYLAAAGVGRLTIVDDDRVELSNLQRQPLFTDADIGRPKAIVAADAARRINPHVEAAAVVVFFDEPRAQLVVVLAHVAALAPGLLPAAIDAARDLPVQLQPAQQLAAVAEDEAQP